jgi:hypothetical protein
MKLLFAYFMAVMVTWMSFASVVRELRRGALTMLETRIVMSSPIFRLILTLMPRLALLLVLCLDSLMYLTIAYMVSVNERIALCLDALVTAHVLIMVIFSHVGLVFLLEDLTLNLSPDTWTVHVFPHRGTHPTGSNGDVLKTVKTSSGRMVKCWIPKIYLTNPSIESLTSSRPM